MQKDKQSELSFRWGHCAITQQPLQKPIVACQLGRLYSKVAVIEALLDKTKLPETASHIKSLKDVKELNLTDNPAFKPMAKTNEVYDESLTAPYICPVTGLEMTGKFRFVLMWTCGCVFSERAYKAVTANVCHTCQKPISEQDVIVLNGTDEDISSARVKMDARKARAKVDKKSAKSKNGAGESSNSSEELKTDEGKPSSSGKKPAESLKRSATHVDLIDPKFKKTKGDYSVAKDPKASEVYKSLFTTHESAAKQTRAHWVTYNPFYN